jgi:hypothetical protein
MTSDWSSFAWQGIQIETPRAWELGSVTGDRRKGYFRLDDADMPRVEAKWQSGDPRASVPAVADRYLKKAGLADAAAERKVERNVRLAPPADMETEFFITRGEPNAMHMAARCRQCGRVALLRVCYRSDESLQPVMARLFGSYRDHARNGKTPWSLYGLQFEVLEDYALLRHNIRAGRVELEFAGKRARILAARVGLAETVLKKMSLLDWLKKDSTGQSPACPLVFAETKRGEHATVEVSGRERSLARRMLGRLRVARGLAWHCEPSNALYIARWFGPEENVPEFSAFAESFLCHEP